MNLNFKFINKLACCVLLMFLTPQVHSNEESEKDRLFSLGMDQSKNNNWLEAKSAFESLLQLNENLHRARVELAIAYMHLNEYALAIKQFDTVLSVTELPENVHEVLHAPSSSIWKPLHIEQEKQGVDSQHQKVPCS